MTIVGTSHHGSGGSGTSSAPPKVVARLDGLPKGHDKVTTYGGGGGTPIHIKSGPLKGWRVGGGKRGKVFGTTHHITMTITTPYDLVWAFPPIGASPGTDPGIRIYYENIPLNITRPGGELVQLKITPFDWTNITLFHPEYAIKTPTTPFFFVSDNYTAFQMKQTIQNTCHTVDLGDVIPFNSTGDIHWKSLVQFYRGDSAAVYLQGYNNTNELPGNPKLAPNPPFSQNVSGSALGCVNSTIGLSIPLMHGGIFPWYWIFVGIIFLIVLIVVAVVCLCKWCDRRRGYARVK